MRRDSIFYQLFRQSPTLLFELLAQPPDNADGYVFQSIEVKETSFRMDGVFLPPDTSGVAYFCEVQFQLDELLYERIVSEIGIFVYRNRDLVSDWRAVAIYPSRSVEQSNLQTVSELLTSGRIQRIYLDELGAIEELPLGVGLMVLTILESDAATQAARSLIDRARGERGIIELISTIIVYKFSNLSRDEVDVMLGIELAQTRVYQEAKEEGKIEGKAEGKAEGELIGETRGKAEEAKSLVVRQLNRKLGNLTVQLQEQVDLLGIDRLESLSESLLDFTSIADLESWLSEN